MYNICQVNVGWSSWESWKACTITCGNGQQSRRRYCDNPVPENNGVYCLGQGFDYNSCTLPACPGDKLSYYFIFHICVLHSNINNYIHAQYKILEYIFFLTFNLL